MVKIIRFDELHSVDIKSINLNNDKEVGIAIGKGYGLPEIRVERIIKYVVGGKLITLPNVVHLFKCVYPIQCTAISDKEEVIFYWVHDFMLNTLRPILIEDVDAELSSRLKDLEEITKKDIIEQMEILEEEPLKIKEERVEPGELYIPTRKHEKLPTVEEVAKNPKLLLQIPESLVVVFGNRIYDKRWFTEWHAKMMSLGGGYKRLYNPEFMKSSPDKMLIDAYLPYLIGGRYRTKAISDIDLRMLDITEGELGKFNIK